MNLNSLYDVYVHELKDLYSAEKQIIDALPKMAQAATNEELRKAFESHLEQSKEHLTQVRNILDHMDENPGNVHCKGMEGLLKEGNSIIKESGTGDAKDAALITAAQRVEHYEMAAYGSARTFARLLGYDEASDMLQHILDQEGDTDEKLTDIAVGGMFTSGINEEAMANS